MTGTLSRRRLAIVGAGASGVAAFVAAVRFGVAQSIDVVDPLGIGHSVAFAAKHPELLCNTSVETMSILDDDPDDFLIYLRSIGVPATRDAFVPRMYVSRYLCARYTRFATLARAAGIGHRLVKAAAHRVEKTPSGSYRVSLDDGTAFDATDVLVCTGSGAPYVPDAVKPHVGAPRLFESLYPEDHVLSALAPRSRVLVLGSRLSAVDSALLLCGAGHAVEIASPSGRLPAVRTATPRACPVPIDADALARLDLNSAALSWRLMRIVARSARAVRGRALRQQVERMREPIERLRREVVLARRGATDWQSILVGYMDAAQARLREAAPERQRRAIADCSRAVGRYLFACPLENAEKLLAYAQAQRLTVRAGTPAQLHGGPRWGVRWDDGAQDTYDAIVCATGFHKTSLSSSANALTFDANSGADFGEDAHAAGVAPHVSSDMRISLPCVGHAERIWTLGIASQSAAPIVNAVYQAVRQAGDLLRSWQAADQTQLMEASVASEAG